MQKRKQGRNPEPSSRRRHSENVQTTGECAASKQNSALAGKADDREQNGERKTRACAEAKEEGTVGECVMTRENMGR